MRSFDRLYDVSLFLQSASHVRTLAACQKSKSYSVLACNTEYVAYGYGKTVVLDFQVLKLRALVASNTPRGRYDVFGT